MKVCIITCHDVYNTGASLQAFALEKYLITIGHDAEIIDYKPQYLSSQYSLTRVNNPRYDRPIIKTLYILAKLPERLKRRRSRKKAEFDRFKLKYLKCTNKTYKSYEELSNDPPLCDELIAGSDQIWNPLFKNGKDPAFFLQFGSDKVKRISYAASFAVDRLSDSDTVRMAEWLKAFNHISVREQSGIRLLNQLGFDGEVVCDPVFLIEKEEWLRIAGVQQENKHVFVYDFDNSAIIKELIKTMDEEIVSYFPMDEANYVDECGPIEFLRNIATSSLIISNSFHATAFALIFHIPFYVIERKENINTRMKDLLDYLSMKNRIIRTATDIKKTTPIDWEEVDRSLNTLIERSKNYLNNSLKENKG